MTLLGAIISIAATAAVIFFMWKTVDFIVNGKTSKVSRDHSYVDEFSLACGCYDEMC